MTIQQKLETAIRLRARAANELEMAKEMVDEKTVMLISLQNQCDEYEALALQGAENLR
jgi:hypothetical protein